MASKASRIISAALSNPEWTQEQIAAYCGSTSNSVKVVLCRARKNNQVKFREVDSGRRRGSPLYWSWLPDSRRAEYRTLRAEFGAAEARRMLEVDMIKNGAELAKTR